MATPLGFKTFVTGDVLTAADTNGYLMQGIWTFATAVARDAAVTAPVEGNTCYLKDTDVIQVYSGSAWVTKSGGSPLTTKGDLYTFSTTDARLGVGTNGQALIADSTALTGLKWGSAASASSYSLINAGGTAMTGAATITVSGISGMNSLFIRVENYGGPASSATSLRINTDTGANYIYYGMRAVGNSSASKTNIAAEAGNTTSFLLAQQGNTTSGTGYGGFWINAANSTGIKFISGTSGNDNSTGDLARSFVLQGLYAGTSTISSISMFNGSGNFTSGTVYVYGSAA